MIAPLDKGFFGMYICGAMDLQFKGFRFRDQIKSSSGLIMDSILQSIISIIKIYIRIHTIS